MSKSNWLVFNTEWQAVIIHVKLFSSSKCNHEMLLKTINITIASILPISYLNIKIAEYDYI